MTGSQHLALGAILGGKYRIDRLLGEGGMGAVYLAENLDIGRQVAIKILHAKLGRDEDMLRRFRQEARASAMISHPNIVDVLDMGLTADGEAFIVMERLEGQTLSARLKQHGRLAAPEVAAVMIEVLDGLAAAHESGFIHRDLKPENIFLVWRPKWGVKILDFGISRFAGPDEIRITASNTVMGSVLYMSPEQAKDAHAAGPAADLYSIGAVLYHLLAGRPPFLGNSYSEVLSRVLVDPHTPLAELAPATPPALAALVDGLLVKDPAARPAEARAVRDALRDAVGSITIPEPDTESLADTRPAPAPRSVVNPLDATAAPAPRSAITVATQPPDRVLASPSDAVVTRPPAARRRGLVALALVLGGAGIAGVIVLASSGSSGPSDAAVGGPPAEAAIDAASEDAFDAAPDAPPDASPPDAPLDARPATRPDHRPATTVPADAAVPTRDAAGKQFEHIDFNRVP